MREIKILPIIKYLVLAFLFFALGRLIVIQMGSMGVWIVLLLVIAFYVVWWINYQRGGRK